MNLQLKLARGIDLASLLFIGSIWTYSAIAKLASISNFAAEIEKVDPRLSTVGAAGIIVSELYVGVSLLMRYHVRMALILELFLLMVFTLYTIRFSPAGGCHCFGSTNVLDATLGQKVARNLIIAFISLGWFAQNSFRVRLERRNILLRGQQLE